MIRILAFLALWGCFFAASLSYLAWLEVSEYASPALMALSGEALLAAEGRVSLADMATAFPPLPHLLALIAAQIGGGSVPPASVAAAFAGGLFGACFAANLRSAGFSRPVCVALAVLMLANPLFLHALADGPAMMLVLIAVLMLAHGLFGLRGGGTAPDAMTVGLALALLVFSHEAGLAIVLAALPFLALSAPRDLVARAPGGLFLVLIFPAGFSLLAFAYIGWAFAGAGPTLAQLPPQDAAAAGSSAAAVWSVAAAVFLAGPIVPAFVVRHRAWPMLVAPSVAACGLLLATALLAPEIGLAADPVLAAVPVLALAAACAAHWTDGTGRSSRLLVLATLGAVGGGLLVAGASGPATAAWRLASLGIEAGHRADLATVAAFLQGRRDVLIDAAAHSQIVALRQTAEGLLVPGDPAFEISLLARRLESRFVAVSDPAGQVVVRDRINRAFPSLYRQGADGYALIYDEGGWRIFERGTRAGSAGG